MRRHRQVERVEMGVGHADLPPRVREVIVVHEGPVPVVSREVLTEAELAAAKVISLPPRACDHRWTGCEGDVVRICALCDETRWIIEVPPTAAA